MAKSSYSRSTYNNDLIRWKYRRFGILTSHELAGQIEEYCKANGISMNIFFQASAISMLNSGLRGENLKAIVESN